MTIGVAGVPVSVLSAASATAVLTAALTFSAPVPAGAFLVASVYAPSGVASTIQLNDSANNSYILVAVNGDLFTFVSCGKIKAMASPQFLTVSFGASTTYSVTMTAFPGVYFAGVDVIKNVSGTSSSPSGTTANVHYPNEITCAALVNANAGGAATWNSAWTKLNSAHTGTGEFCTQAYLNQAGGSGAPVTSSASITSSAWAMTIVTLMPQLWAVGTIPVIPSQQAGTIATSNDMNNLATAAAFLMNKPFVNVTSQATQSITANTETSVSWAGSVRDTDGFWDPDNPTLLTIQTPGLYRCRYSIPFNSNNLFAVVRVQLGPNNPGVLGSHHYWWYGWSASNTPPPGVCVGGGIIPDYLFQGDAIEIRCVAATTGTFALSSPQPAYCSLKFVST